MGMDFERIKAYRAQTFRLAPNLRLKDPDEAIAYVRQRGFIFFWPISQILLPSLWVAAAGNRPVADAHDDPGHVTWGWKDALLGKRQWYYAKVLRKKATIISLDLAPYFYTLSENYGSPEEDYLTLYEQGRLTLEARVVYETLLNKGPLDTVALRRATHMSSPESDHRFARALSDLQVDFKILPVGVTQAGAWHYAFVYDVVHHHFPELMDQAHDIQENEARCKLVESYFLSVGAAQIKDIARLFGWSNAQCQKAVSQLVRRGMLQSSLEIEGQAGEWIVLSEIAGGIA